MTPLLVLTTVPDQEHADRLATLLVENQLAACVQVLTPCRAVYRWEGKLERAEEIPLLIKTRAGRYTEVEAAIRLQHPYALPEIIALPISRGLPAYLDWITQETEPPCRIC